MAEFIARRSSPGERAWHGWQARAGDQDTVEHLRSRLEGFRQVRAAARQQPQRGRGILDRFRRRNKAGG